MRRAPSNKNTSCSKQSEFGYEYLVITPDRSLVFPSVEYVRAVVTKAGLKQGLSSIPVVIDCRHIQGADFTAAKVNIAWHIVELHTVLKTSLGT